MSSTGVNPEKVITRMAQQIGQLSAELAMRDAALEEANERIVELEPKTNGGAPDA